MDSYQPPKREDQKPLRFNSLYIFVSNGSMGWIQYLKKKFGNNKGDKLFVLYQAICFFAMFFKKRRNRHSERNHINIVNGEPLFISQRALGNKVAMHPSTVKRYLKMLSITEPPLIKLDITPQGTKIIITFPIPLPAYNPHLMSKPKKIKPISDEKQRLLTELARLQYIHNIDLNLLLCFIQDETGRRKKPLNCSEAELKKVIEEIKKPVQTNIRQEPVQSYG
jgi:hypothetical protein